jgi:hypothetical protein
LWELSIHSFESWSTRRGEPFDCFRPCPFVQLGSFPDGQCFFKQFDRSVAENLTEKMIDYVLPRGVCRGQQILSKQERLTSKSVVKRVLHSLLAYGVDFFVGPVFVVRFRSAAQRELC